MVEDPADALTRLGERRYTWPELCRIAGVEHEIADRLWRALGFPDVPPEEAAYTDEDVRALTIATEGLDALSAPDRERAVDLMVREARSVSGHLGRIVEIQVDTLAEYGRLGVRRGAAEQALERGIDRSDLGWLLFYGLRRRLDETLRRRASTDGAAPPTLAIGFVDLVGFTEASTAMPEDELARMLAEFEALAWDVVTEAGGQIVKLIGDEAMMVFPSADGAADAALEIVESTDTRKLPAARAGLALGPLLARAGDYFGISVNLASRLTDAARPGEVWADESFGAELGDGFGATLLGPVVLKGIGEVEPRRIARS